MWEMPIKQGMNLNEKKSFHLPSSLPSRRNVGARRKPTQTAPPISTPMTPAPPISLPTSTSAVSSRLMSTPTTFAHTDAGVKRRRETQDTQEEKVREQNRFPWKARRESKWGSPNTPSDVINMGTHVFECEWVKKDSDLNRFLAKF